MIKMITEPTQLNEECRIQEYYCVCCNNLVARAHLYNLKDISIITDIKPNHINGFDIICGDCVQKLRSGRKLF